MKYKSRFQLLADVRKSGAFENSVISSLDSMSGKDAREWFEKNVDLDGYTGADIESLWTKKVTITADAGEEVELIDGAEPEEAKEMEGDEEEEIVEKSAKRAMSTKAAKAQGKLASIADSYGKPMSQTVSRQKAYTRAAQQGLKINGKNTVFSDGETAEAFGAWVRTKAFPNLEYAGKSRDQDIVRSMGSTKALGSNQNSTGGFALVDQFSNDLIELMPQYGAARRAFGITNMPTGNWVGPRVTDDVDFSVIGEGQAASGQDNPQGDNVRLDARDAIGLVRAQNSWLADAAIDAADLIGRSMARGAAKFEDANVFLSRSGAGTSNSFQGIGDKIGANTTHDANYSAWGDFTVSDDTTLRSLLSDRAYNHSQQVGYVMSPSNYAANFEKVGLSAGGATPTDFQNGTVAANIIQATGADTVWNGKPVWFTPVMPSVYAADQISAYYGAFDIAGKLGHVVNSMAIASSEDRYFEYGQTGFRMLLRMATNMHDVNNSTGVEDGSLVVALKD